MNKGHISLLKDKKKQDNPRDNSIELWIGIVVSRFNPTITDRLLTGALSALSNLGVTLETIQVEEVPGAFELPGVALQMGKSKKIDAVICLGAVIRGETNHFHYICSEVSRGIGQVALTLGKPVIFGVLTTDSIAQAKARSGVKGNKGAEAAEAAVAMAQLYKRLKVSG